MYNLLTYTQKDYKGYEVHFAASMHAAVDWRGHFQVHKDGSKIAGETLANSFATREMAEAKALDFGMERVDQILADLAKT